MTDLEKLAPIETSWAYYDEACSIREATAKAVAQRCYELCMNAERDKWTLMFEDGKVRGFGPLDIAAAIASEFGLELQG